MPLYDYLCDSCGERTEVLQRFSDSPELACPKCGKAMRRLPSAPSFQFKGSGFYLTDYAKKSGGTEGTSPRSGSEKPGDRTGESGGSKTESAAPSTSGESSTSSAAAPAAGTSKPSGGSASE